MTVYLMTGHWTDDCCASIQFLQYSYFVRCVIYYVIRRPNQTRNLTCHGDGMMSANGSWRFPSCAAVDQSSVSGRIYKQGNCAIELNGSMNWWKDDLKIRWTLKRMFNWRAEDTVSSLVREQQRFSVPVLVFDPINDRSLADLTICGCQISSRLRSEEFWETAADRVAIRFVGRCTLSQSSIEVWSLKFIAALQGRDESELGKVVRPRSTVNAKLFG